MDILKSISSDWWFFFSLIFLIAGAYCTYRLGNKGTDELKDHQEKIIDSLRDDQRREIDSLRSNQERQTKIIVGSHEVVVAQLSSIIISTSDERAIKDAEKFLLNYFKSGIASTGPISVQTVDSEINEWYERAKKAGINPPHPNISIYILGGKPHESPRGPGEAWSTRVGENNGRSIITCYDQKYPNVAIWRGLSSVLLGRRIFPFTLDAPNPYADLMMYQDFYPGLYREASVEKQDQYWHDMFFIDPQ